MIAEQVAIGLWDCSPDCFPSQDAVALFPINFPPDCRLLSTGTLLAPDVTTPAFSPELLPQPGTLLGSLLGEGLWQAAGAGGGVRNAVTMMASELTKISAGHVWRWRMHIHKYEQ